MTPLEQLRQNLDKEAKCWVEATHELQGHLSLYQRANFILNTEYRHISLQNLDCLWGAIYETQNTK